MDARLERGGGSLPPGFIDRVGLFAKESRYIWGSTVSRWGDH